MIFPIASHCLKFDNWTASTEQDIIVVWHKVMPLKADSYYGGLIRQFTHNRELSQWNFVLNKKHFRNCRWILWSMLLVFVYSATLKIGTELNCVFKLMQKMRWKKVSSWSRALPQNVTELLFSLSGFTTRNRNTKINKNSW